MSRKSRKFILRIALLLLPIMTLSTTLAQGTGPGGTGGTGGTSSGSQVVSIVISPARQRAALAYWTHARIAGAKALALPVDAGAAAVDAPAVEQPAATGPAESSPSGLALPDADRKARAAYPADWKASTAAVDEDVMADELAGTSQVFTSYIANPIAAMQTIYPHRWVGRLSFTTPAGTSYCSGTSISGNVMLTAAHCVYDTTNNSFYSNWVLSPAYRSGSIPYGTFAATQCFVLADWINLAGSFAINTWSRHDVAVCKMGNNSSGTTLNNAVGWMGRQWNQSYIRHFHDLGYPFRDYNNNLLTNAGLFLRLCAAESFQQTTETRGIGCDFGGGISGGPWMVNYRPNSVSGNADGVNSGLFIGTKNLYGARFNSSNIVPLCTAAAC